MISKLMNPDVIEFIQENLNEDPSIIALKAANFPDLPIREIATQIASRQKALKKLPEWTNNQRLVFPPKENLEQASSQETAEFKALLYSGYSFVDLTGGSGIDAYYLSRKFKKSAFIEPNEHLCDIARHNFIELEAEIRVHQSTAEEFISRSEQKYDLIYLDPSRRSDSKQRMTQIEDYHPNVISMLPDLMRKGDRVLVKVSPMVDIKQSIKQLQYVSKVICLAVRNEMKEILFELNMNVGGLPVIDAINLKKNSFEEFSANYDDEKNAISEIDKPQAFIYEPNSAIRKAGFFKLIASKFELKKLDSNTHLYTSKELVIDIPGRILKLDEILKADKKIIKKHVPSQTINVISKNYPLNTREIKKKYQLKDGGDQFLIFCKSEALGNVVLKCSKVNKSV